MACDDKRFKDCYGRYPLKRKAWEDPKSERLAEIHEHNQ